MHTQGRVYVFFDFSSITDPAQQAQAEDFIAVATPRVTCKCYHAQARTVCDTRLIVDLLMGAREDAYDEAIVVSADADLAPAIAYIRKRWNKNVITFRNVSDFVASHA